MDEAKAVNPPGVFKSPLFAQAMRWGELLFVSCQAAVDERGNVVSPGDCAAQSEFIMRNIKTILEVAGSDMGRVVKITCFLTRTEDYPAYNSVRRKWFASGPPASSTVIVAALVRPELVVEVEAIAVVPARART